MENTLPRPNLLTWFEIPVLDFDRAIHCYSTLLDIPLHKEKYGPEEMAIFTAKQGAVTGALVISPSHKPSTHGTLLYFDCNPSLKTVLDRAAAQALKIVLPSTELPNDIGFVAIVEDTEGNRVGLHAKAA